jgi:hypothetical protein
MQNPASAAYGAVPYEHSSQPPSATTPSIAAQQPTSSSAVSWAAIIGGAVTAAAITLVLLALGGGIGLTTVSPWSGSGASPKAFSIGAAIWLIVVQWLASGVGGYLTGRLRTKWVGIHTDEVFFRDTAHGFLAWALATVMGVAFLASAAVATGIGAEEQSANVSASTTPTTYLVDSLFRPSLASSGAAAGTAAAPDTSAVLGEDGATRTEITGILAMASRTGSLPAADRAYIAQRVAARTGLAQADAEKRVDAVDAQLKEWDAKARQTADAARKATATFSIFAALSLVIGAFIASAAAAYGGLQRDTW